MTETYGAATSDVDADLSVELSGADRPALTHPATEHSAAGHSAAVDSTGDPRVDDAMARLVDVDGAPVSEHLDIYQDVHRRLHEALADLDSR